MSLLTLKELDPSEIQIFDRKPVLECRCCYEKVTTKMEVSAQDWLIAANTFGWRQIETKEVIISAACPTCIEEIENLAKDDIDFANNFRRFAG